MAATGSANGLAHNKEMDRVFPEALKTLGVADPEVAAIIEDEQRRQWWVLPPPPAAAVGSSRRLCLWMGSLCWLAVNALQLVRQAAGLPGGFGAWLAIYPLACHRSIHPLAPPPPLPAARAIGCSSSA